jgi:hypothetical protein
MSSIGLLNETDVPTTFDPGDADFLDAFALGIQAQILLQIMFADVIFAHHVPKNAAILHNDFRRSFEKNTNRMGIVGGGGEQSMQHDNDKAATKRG